MTRMDDKVVIRPLTARIIFKALLGVAGTALVLWIWQASIVRISKNFEEVDPGRFYRSAQLTPAELKDVVQQYGIKTVISLRGAPENSYWVPKQKEVLAKLGVAFHWFGWTSDYFPATEELKGYLSTLKSAQFPVLVHCRTGSDRTGEATAMYAIDFMKVPKEEAIEKYLSIKNYHVPIFHPAKIEFVRKYQGMDQALAHYDHCAEGFSSWAQPGRCPKR